MLLICQDVRRPAISTDVQVEIPMPTGSQACLQPFWYWSKPSIDYLPILEHQGFHLILAPTPAERAEAITRHSGQINAVLTRGPLGLYADEIAALPNLKIICVIGAGYEHVDYKRRPTAASQITNGAGEAGAVSGFFTGLTAAALWILFIHVKESAPLGLCKLLFGVPTLAGTATKLQFVDLFVVALPLSIIVTIVVSILTKPPAGHLKKCFRGF